MIGGYAKGIYIVENYVYVAQGIDNLQIIDISDPTNPSRTGKCNLYVMTANSAFIIEQDGTLYVYLAYDDWGFVV
ncbi:MAG: hypothetical protein GF308_16760 [Candidatus Heimdallarchaeota archaeon]|nr:hypothetical protein [Candidatus Heimdallarchaeota archaeon]